MALLDGKVALVTGGGSGIGKAVVERFIQEGARVGILERVPERVQELPKELGESVVAVQGDVSKLEDNERAVAETVRAFGQLDIFVGNAGIFDRFTPIADFPKEKLSSAFDELIGVNVKGYILGAKAAIPELQKTEGCMIFTASHAGYEPGGGGVLYMTSKHAVMGMIAQLAYELAPIRVNGVGPGGTMTDLRGLNTMDQSGPAMQRTPEMVERMRSGNPLGIAATGEDHAGIYAFLASKELARTLTGITIRSDAGVNVRGLIPWAQIKQRQQAQQEAASQSR